MWESAVRSHESCIIKVWDRVIMTVGVAPHLSCRIDFIIIIFSSCVIHSEFRKATRTDCFTLKNSLKLNGTFPGSVFLPEFYIHTQNSIQIVQIIPTDAGYKTNLTKSLRLRTFIFCFFLPFVFFSLSLSFTSGCLQYLL